MSQENVEVIRRTYEAFNRGDVEAVLANYHPDCELYDPPEMPDAPDVYTRHDGVRRWIANMRSLGGDELHYQPKSFTASGERVLVEVQGKAVGQGSGVPVEWTAHCVFTIRDTRIGTARFFLDRAQALEAAGLRE